MNLSVAPAQFTEGEALELTEYRPVNRFAILSVVLGIFSCLAILSPLLLALPIVGAASGFFAIWQLAGPQSLQSGKPAAKWGIFLAVFFGLWSTSAGVSKQNLLANQARTYALQWFELFREGKLQEAHQLTMYQSRRATTGTTLEKFYEKKERATTKPDGTPLDATEHLSEMEPMPAEEYANFNSRPLQKRLAELGKKAEYKFLRTVHQEQVSTSEMHLLQQYLVTVNEGSAPETFVIEIRLERSEDNHVANWRIDDSIREVQ